MRYILLFLAIIILCGCSTQRRTLDTGTEFKTSYRWQHAIAPAALSFASGACWGVHETVVHHPDRIPPHWNQQWWNNQLSWRNKYRNGDPTQGPAWWGAKYLTFGQDAKHTFATLDHLSLLSAGVCITLGERRPWWHYAIDLGVSLLARPVGFHSTYTLFFHP